MQGRRVGRGRALRALGNASVPRAARSAMSTNQPIQGATSPTKNHASLDQAELILRSIREAVIMTDLSGVVTYWNDAATRMFGWTAEEMLGRPHRALPRRAAGLAGSADGRARHWAGVGRRVRGCAQGRLVDLDSGTCARSWVLMGSRPGSSGSRRTSARRRKPSAACAREILTRGAQLDGGSHRRARSAGPDPGREPRLAALFRG